MCKRSYMKAIGYMKATRDTGTSVVTLVIEPLGSFFSGGKGPRIVQTSLHLTPNCADLGGSMLSIAAVVSCRSLCRPS